MEINSLENHQKYSISIGVTEMNVHSEIGQLMLSCNIDMDG